MSTLPQDVCGRPLAASIFHGIMCPGSTSRRCVRMRATSVSYPALITTDAASSLLPRSRSTATTAASAMLGICRSAVTTS